METNNAKIAELELQKQEIVKQSKESGVDMSAMLARLDQEIAILRRGEGTETKSE